MRILAVSDLHGDLACVWEAVSASQPDVLLCCGDWGDPGEVELSCLQEFSERFPVYTVYGNHDDQQTLSAWRNRNGSAVLLPTGEALAVGGMALAGISGIWAKSHRQPYYVTDEDVDAAALQLQQSGRKVDLLVTHGCPLGVADLTAQNRHGGQRCFLRAFQTLQPRVYLTGHLHRAQEHRTHAGQIIRNVGETPRGDATVIDWEGDAVTVRSLRDLLG